MASIVSTLGRPGVLRAGAIVAAVSLPVIWVGWSTENARMSEEELASVGNKIILGETLDDMLRMYRNSVHSKIDVFDDGRLVERELLITTPSQLSAGNSVLHVRFDERRRVECVAFRTEDSAWVHPGHMPQDRGCASTDRRLYRIALGP